MKAILLGSIHREGKTKEGKAYSFYNSFFEIPMPENGFGKNVLVGVHSEPFSCIDAKNIGKEFEVYSYLSNNRTYINGCHLA